MENWKTYIIGATLGTALLAITYFSGYYARKPEVNTEYNTRQGECIHVKKDYTKTLEDKVAEKKDLVSREKSGIEKKVKTIERKQKNKIYSPKNTYTSRREKPQYRKPSDALIPDSKKMMQRMTKYYEVSLKDPKAHTSGFKSKELDGLPTFYALSKSPKEDMHHPEDVMPFTKILSQHRGVCSRLCPPGSSYSHTNYAQIGKWAIICKRDIEELVENTPEREPMKEDLVR